MKEIGGYFELEQLISKEYYSDLIALNSCRNALLYLLQEKKINKLYIPYYICGSVSEICAKNNYDFEYYKISDKLLPLFDKKLTDSEYLLIVNYYGQISDSKVIALKKIFGNIILDNSQAFFQRPIAGVDTIYSCRKFFGVPDGGYLSTDVKLIEDLTIDISKDRMIHILGRYEGKASDYYSFFKDNEAYLDSLSLKKMSKITHNILGAIDYSEARRQRNENYSILDSELKSRNKLELLTPDAPFAYPLYVANGTMIRQIMAQKNIYIPILWPNVLNNSTSESMEYDYANNILPLPCDQRYGRNDMSQIIDYVHAFCNI